MNVHNYTGLTEEEVYNLPILKSGKNHWRGRNIHLRQHPTDPLKVISEGTTFDGSMRVICDEMKSQWHREFEAAGDFETF